ncbi:hypothetical protein CKAH01_03130 [Colletotrichum kahawae]|uniref:Uncharacterized protein n=1 Tax=Colletotrichum kahawae TaxID=34407 RepID=A0AAD9YV05_COLKA|nr:hypothetical protein CKAH01_03130 [Colletotrichum kahawae]
MRCIFEAPARLQRQPRICDCAGRAPNTVRCRVQTARIACSENCVYVCVCIWGELMLEGSGGMCGRQVGIQKGRFDP